MNQPAYHSNVASGHNVGRLGLRTENYLSQANGALAGLREDVAPNAISVPWRFLVPQQAAGPIVGRQGENLRAVIGGLSDSARIDVTREGDLANIEDKMVTIRSDFASEKV